MESNLININDLYDLDYENKTCVDCKAAMPKYVSINNAIIICQSCALKHKALGYNISYIREIKSEWDSYLLSFMQRGGNGRFIRLIREYNIEDYPIEYKYITKAAEYHRLTIKSEVSAEEPPMQLPIPNGSEYCNMTECYFPEFENYQLYTGEAQVHDDSNSAKIFNSIKLVGKGLGKVYDALTEPQMKEKIISGSAMTYNAMSVAGQFLFQQSKPLLKYISIKATQGIGLIYNQMKENLEEEEQQKKNGLKQSKVQGNEEDEEDYDKDGNGIDNDIEEDDKDSNDVPPVSIETKKESNKKKSKRKNKHKGKERDRDRVLRPKSIGKEVIVRHTTIFVNNKHRSNSNQKSQIHNNCFNNHNNMPQPIGINSNPYYGTNVVPINPYMSNPQFNANYHNLGGEVHNVVNNYPLAEELIQNNLNYQYNNQPFEEQNIINPIQKDEPSININDYYQVNKSSINK